MTGSSIWHDNVLIITEIIDNTFDARPRVLDIVVVPPKVAVLDYRAEVRLHSRVDLVDGPAAGVDHGFAGSVEVEAEFGVASVHFARQGVAAVELDVIDVPRRE